MLTWYVIGSAAAIAIAWLAAILHLSDNAPVGIVSLGVGGVLGAALGGLAAWLNIRCRTRLVVGTLLLAIITVLAEHAWLYCDFRRQWHEARADSAEVALFRPETPWSPAEYLARELTAASAVLWALDGVLIVVASVWIAVLLQRKLSQKRVTNDAA